jgi:hypothetical protein
MMTELEQQKGEEQWVELDQIVVDGGCERESAGKEEGGAENVWEKEELQAAVVLNFAEWPVAH